MYNDEDIPRLKVELLEWIADGNFLKPWCREPNRPSFKTVYRWKADDPDFSKLFDEARLVGADAIAEEIIEIIDTEPQTTTTDRGTSCVDSGHVAWMKNRAWVRQQALAKWFPTKYGDRVQVDGKLTHEHTTMEMLNAARKRATGRDDDEGGSGAAP